MKGVYCLILKYVKRTLISHLCGMIYSDDKDGHALMLVL
jgi:hypothetical protein